MDVRAIVAIVAAVSACIGGVITAVLGPIIKHRLEQSAAERERRREQIEKWRSMVVQVERQSREPGTNLRQMLQLHPDFLSLEPHLTPGARESVHKRFFLVQMGHELPIHLRIVSDEISRIEKTWKL